MMNYYSLARKAACNEIAGFNEKDENLKKAFLTLASDYLEECEPFALPDSPYHDSNGEFSIEDFVIHMWDSFSWHDASEAREYWNIPENVEGLEFWQQAYDAANEYHSFVYSDNATIIAWLDA